jgi:hypothetical protein
MVLVYYRLYITYTLMEFLFGLDGWMDQNNVCRDIQKIEELIRSCLPYLFLKNCKVTKRLKTMGEIEAILSRLYVLCRLYRTAYTRAKE